MENYLARLGSETAKNGFENEKEIASKFNNWKSNNAKKRWRCRKRDS